MLVPLLMRKGDVVKAEQHLSAIPTHNDELAQFVKLYGVCIQLVKAGKTLNEMDPVQEQHIRDVAATNTRTSIQAKNILNWVFDEAYPELIENLQNNARMGNFEENDQNEVNIEQNYELKVFPNPANEIVNVFYKISENKGFCYFQIYDMMSKKIFYYELII